MTSTERDPAWSERLNPRNWSLAAKLVAVGLVPTLLALVLGVLRISDQAGVAAQLGQDNRLLDVRSGITATAQALQAERNAAVLYVAGGRQGDRGPLDQAVAASDTQLDRVRAALSDSALLDASSTTALQNAEGGFTQLPVLRTEVGNSVVGTDAVSSRYTSVIQRAGVLERALVRQGAAADAAGL
ncbi:nitrate- and nitrite sensing domain-containing protein, partial [Pseudonocardia pini]|uniref:nitrate- and nitrite sensing domain-containing protein n=1 Tax=Pseudonocardia pini TaxID=2758030 RepID=UPI0015F031A3